MSKAINRSRTVRRLALCALGGAVVLRATAAHAQGNPYAAPIGGRSALMGDTGIALGVDGAAPFQNPATIVRLDDQRFSFSVNFYNYSVSYLSGWHQPGPTDSSQFGKVALSGTGLATGGFSGLPSTLCLFFNLAKGSPDPNAEIGSLSSWRQKLAICLGTTESQSFEFTALPYNGTTSLGPTAQSQSLVQSWNRLNIGPSYSVALSKRIAVGLSLHGVYTNDSFLLDSSSITASAHNGGVQSSLGVASGGNSFDVAAILGAIYSPRPYTVGLSLSLPAVHAFGSYTGTDHNEFSSGTTATSMVSNASGSFSATPPVRVAVGVGAEWPRITVEVDASLNIPSPTGFTANVSGTTTTLTAGKLGTSPLQSSFNVQEHTVVNTSVGAEYFVQRNFSLLGGFALNVSALPSLNPSVGVGNLIQERDNIATLSAGVGTYSPGSNLLLGFQFGYGWGESIAANPYVTPSDLVVIDTHSYSALFILAGSTNLKSLGRAVERIEDVISGDKPSTGKDANPLDRLERDITGDRPRSEAPTPDKATEKGGPKVAPSRSPVEKSPVEKGPVEKLPLDKPVEKKP